MVRKLGEQINHEYGYQNRSERRNKPNGPTETNLLYYMSPITTFVDITDTEFSRWGNVVLNHRVHSLAVALVWKCRQPFSTPRQHIQEVCRGLCPAASTLSESPSGRTTRWSWRLLSQPIGYCRFRSNGDGGRHGKGCRGPKCGVSGDDYFMMLFHRPTLYDDFFSKKREQENVLGPILSVRFEVYMIRLRSIYHTPNIES